MARYKTWQTLCHTLWPACFLKTYLYNFGFEMGTNFILGKHVLSGNDNKLINCVTCWCGNVVTVATEAYILKFAI